MLLAYSIVTLIYLNFFFLNCASEKEVHSSTSFHEPLNFLITILLGVLGLHLRGLGISPPREYDTVMAFFVMAVIIYGTSFLGIKLGPQNADYLPMLKFVCVICAILACELLASILVDPLRLVMINLCGILVELIRRCYKQIYELLCYAANLVLNTSCNLFQKIYQSQFRQSASQAFNKFTLFGGTKKQDQEDGSQIAEIV